VVVYSVYACAVILWAWRLIGAHKGSAEHEEIKSHADNCMGSQRTLPQMESLSVLLFKLGAFYCLFLLLFCWRAL
jgi:hypothetical protein